MARVKIRLSGRGASQIAQTLAQAFTDYVEELHDRTNTFVEELADTGVQAGVAVVRDTEYANDIDFGVERNDTTGNIHKVTVKASADDKEVHWYTNEKRTERRSEMINPLLMAEFGSGFENIGTYPVQDGFSSEAARLGMVQGSLSPSYGHAKDPNGWGYFDDSGNLHITRGEPPTAPMFNALMAMQEQQNVEKAKRKAFR